MTPEHTAKQLRLAAEILETGHPWEYRVARTDGEEWHNGKFSDISYYAHYSKIRPILATPPDGRPLHNPDNLTAEQVGVGYRLVCYDDDTHADKLEKWSNGEWMVVHTVGQLSFKHCQSTYRLPVSVPWPKPTFQLPQPPPGMQWHRSDGWQEGDLPPGYRPLVKGETRSFDDEIKDKDWDAVGTGDLSVDTRELHCQSRTRRPLTFEHAGKTWTYHRPGNPIPCDVEAIIEVFWRTTPESADFTYDVRRSRFSNWDNGTPIIGWRYADEKKTVPLGPEDVPPGSVLSIKPPRWFIISGISDNGLYVLDDEPLVENLWRWDYLMGKAQINRSIPLTGKWNPDAWESCSKQITV